MNLGLFLEVELTEPIARLDVSLGWKKESFLGSDLDGYMDSEALYCDMK